MEISINNPKGVCDCTHAASRLERLAEQCGTDPFNQRIASSFFAMAAGLLEQASALSKSEASSASHMKDAKLLRERADGAWAKGRT